MTHVNARIEKDYDAQVREHIDFGRVDAAGRKIGVEVLFVPETRTADVEARWRVNPQSLGRWISYKVQPTRDGRSFGASQSAHLAANMEEARAKAMVKAEATRARCAKKYA
jgi:hypothetical protein